MELVTGTIPRNAVTGTEYQGKNIDRLLEAEIAGGYGAGGWAGFKQWISVGRVVRKGEHGTACVRVISGSGAETEAQSDAGPASSWRGVRGFRVFHYDQTTELEAGELEG